MDINSGQNVDPNDPLDDREYFIEELLTLPTDDLDSTYRWVQALKERFTPLQTSSVDQALALIRDTVNDELTLRSVAYLAGIVTGLKPTLVRWASGLATDSEVGFCVLTLTPAVENVLVEARSEGIIHRIFSSAPDSSGSSQNRV